MKGTHANYEATFKVAKHSPCCSRGSCDVSTFARWMRLGNLLEWEFSLCEKLVPIRLVYFTFFAVVIGSGFPSSVIRGMLSPPRDFNCECAQLDLLCSNLLIE